MKKRNLILIALAITTVLVFTQIGALAGTAATGTCVITPGMGSPNCYSGSTFRCNAGSTCTNYMYCCNYLQEQPTCAHIKDNTHCMPTCPCCMG